MSRRELEKLPEPVSGVGVDPMSDGWWAIGDKTGWVRSGTAPEKVELLVTKWFSIDSIEEKAQPVLFTFGSKGTDQLEDWPSLKKYAKKERKMESWKINRFKWHKFYW